ncbi:MAG: ABC transporter substrate-binding protein [Desulfosoma sp.]
MKKVKVFLYVGFLLLCAAGCGREPIRLGFSGTLTGPYSDLGIHGRNGARMAVEDVNAAGGIHGRPLELIVVDDTGLPEGAVQADRDLASRGVVAIIGHMTSSLSMAALSVTRENGVPLISPTTSTPLLRGQKDLFFRVYPATDACARSLARWVTGKPQIQTVCTVRDLVNDAYTRPWETTFVEEYEGMAGSVSCRLAYNSLEPSFLKTLTETLSKVKPDAVLFVSSARDTALMVRALAEAEIPTLILSAGWAQTDALLAEVGPLATRLLIAADNPPIDTTERLREFSWRYRKRFGIDPSFAAVRAYDAVNFLATALKEAKGRREQLPDTLSRPRTLDGLSGRIHIDAFGDASGDFYIVAVRNGRFVVLEWMSGGMP